MKKRMKNSDRPKQYASLAEKLRHCTYSRFCETFGDYKCLKHEHRIINAEIDCVGCRYHRRMLHPDTKPLCQCSICEKQRADKDC